MTDREALPEPICRVRGMLGNIMTVYVKGYERRKGDGLYSAEQMEAYAQAALKSEREAIASLVEQSTLRARQTRAWGDAKQVEPCEIAAAIRARGE